MEKQSREPAPSENWDNLLAHVNDDEMIEFTESGYRMYRSVPTGETRTLSFGAGEFAHSFEVPVTELKLSKEEAPFSELLLRPDGYAFGTGRTEGPIIVSEFVAWKQGLMQPEMVGVAAELEVANRVVEDTQEMILCGNCKGKERFEVPCSCTYGGDSANEDCGTCFGGGTKVNECMYCDGHGTMKKCPDLILTNEFTGEQRVLNLDIARLVADGDVKVVSSGYELEYSDGQKEASQYLTFDVAGYIDAQLIEMGIDSANSVRVRVGAVSDLGLDRLNANTKPSQWLMDRNGIIAHDYADVEVETVIGDAQMSIARSQAWPGGRQRDENGVLFPDEWVIRPLRPIEQAFEDLRVAVASYGASLGFARSPIATGQTGPSFYMLDSNGKVLKELSCEYTIRESIENAWLAVQSLSQ